MSEAEPLETLAQKSADHRVAEFIILAKEELSNLVDSERWSGDCWDVSSSFVRKGKPRVASRLYFFKYGSLTRGKGDAVGTALDPGLRDFAKSYVRFCHSSSPMTFDTIRERLNSLTYIEAAFSELEIEPRIDRLSPIVLTKAVLIATEGVTEKVKYRRGIMIEKVYSFCSRRNFLASNFQWRHGLSRPREPGERIGVEFGDRRAKKVPSERALQSLAAIYRKPLTLRDEILSAVCLICISTPWRASEVLQLRVDCEVESVRHEGGREVPAYGLRAFPRKGVDPHIKWVPDVAVSVVKAAIAMLRRASEDGRSISRWYVNNPTRMYLRTDYSQLRNSKWITATDIEALLGQVNGQAWVKRNGLQAQSFEEGTEKYLFSDLEAAILRQLPKDFPFQNGLQNHPYEECLLIFCHGELKGGATASGSSVMFDTIDINQFNVWLSGNVERLSVFARHGFTEGDGSPIQITTHAFRHWNNAIAHGKGLSPEDIALWSGRDPGQNIYYDHQTAAEFRTDLLEMARKAGGLGPVFEAAENIPNPELLSREEFLRSQIGSSHATELGACFHDYALQPCQNHGDCITCEENGFIKGDHAHQTEMERLLDVMELQLAAAKTALAEEDYGADIWVSEHERKVRRLRLMLANHDDPDIADGTVITLPADRQDSEIEQAMRLRLPSKPKRSSRG